MFVESITVCGFRDIGDAKKLKFNAEEIQNINEIKSDSTFILAFSTIFDAKFDFSDFVQTNQEKSYVEVVLLQRGKNAFFDYNWLRNDRLRIVRDLTNAEKIIINGKEISVAEFQETIKNLGFVNHDDLHIHRLQSNEITRLSHFTSVDLWSLVNHVFSCQNLGKITEINHNREKYRGRQIKNTLTSLETLLPLKIQLRDDIKNFLSLKRRFKTLMHFVEERKIPVLEGQLTKLERELSEIRSELRAKTEEVQLLEVEKVQEMLGKKQLSQAIRHKIKKWSLRVEETKISRGFCFVELFEYVQDLHSSTVASMSTFDEFINGLDSSEFFAATVANQIKIWKLSLKAAEGIENCESAIALNMKTTYNFAKNEEYEKSKDIKEVNEEISKLFTEAKSFTTLNVEKFIEDFSKLQFEIAKELTEVDEHSWIRQKTLFELDQEISVQTISCELNPSLVKTLKAIEVFVRQRRELYADYQGPVFKHLKPLCQGNRCLWPQILSTVNIILFNTGSTARKAFRQLVGSNLKLDSFVLLGLDDLNLPKLAHPSQDLLEKLKSATSMVREDVPFKKTLKTLLRGIVLVNELDADENGLEIFPEIISFGPSGTTTNVRKLLRFQGEIAEKNWILLLQDLQKKIEKLAELEKEIVEDEKHSKDLSKEFSENSKKLTTEIENILIKSNSEQLQQLASRLHHKHDLQMCRLDYFVSLKALQAVDIAEISTWDEKDLMKMSPVPEKQELFIGDDIEHALIQLKFRHKLITDLLENPLNLQRNLDEFTQLYFNQLTKYQEEEQEQLQIQSNPVVIDSKLKVDLIELRCRLYEKKSQKSATVASLKLSTDHVKSRQDKLNFDFSVYDDYKNEPLEDIQEEIMNSHRALAKLISANPNLNRVTMNEYGKLQSMLKKTCAYSEMNISTSHFNVGAKTLPIIEKLQVTLLKDAVFSCRSSFGLTMCDFVESFSLVFFSRETFEMIDSSNYSWDNFNLARLKAMDFLVDWKENTEKVDVACFRRIKALLVIVHIIRTFSVFKFIIIDEKFFDDMNKTLKKNLLSFLEEASSFIQIICLKSDPLDSVQAVDPTMQDILMEVSFNDEVELMDTSENQIDTMN